MLAYQSIDRGKVLRPSLGDVSLDKQATPILENIDHWAEIATRFASLAPEGSVDVMARTLREIRENLDRIGLQSQEQYIQVRERSLQTLRGSFEQIASTIGPFVHAAVIQLDLFDLEKKQRAAEQIIDQKIAELTEQARKATVREAEAEFGGARKQHRNQAVCWGLGSIAAIGAFFWFAFHAYYLALEEPYKGWEGFHVTALRLTILGAIGGSAAFCLRVLRSELHMHQLNAHRRRLAVSMPALIRATETQAQKDQVVLRVVDALASFGTSGLIRGADDAVGPSKFLVDSVTQNFGPSGKG